MAEKIKVSSEAFEDCISKYRTSLDVLSDAVTVYQQAITALQQDWTGRAYAVMAAKALLLIASIVKAISRAHDAVSELQQVEKIFEENEQKQTKAYSALDAGTQSPFNG